MYSSFCHNCQKVTPGVITQLMDDFQGIYTCSLCSSRHTYTRVEKETTNKIEPIHLYNSAEVKKVREKLYKEQNGTDALTGLELAFKDSVTDHNHKTQYVRGVLHRQSNAVLGKIENLHTRYLGYWYPGTLADFLRGAADYIEMKDDERYIHPGWIKRVNIEFNKLTEASKRKILKHLGCEEGANASERKRLFNKLVLSRKFTYFTLLEVLKHSKEAHG